MRAFVNGKQVSFGNLKDMSWTFAQIIERASYGVTLHPGEVIGSGTVGTGCLLELNGSKITDNLWLKPGDQVVMEVDAAGPARKHDPRRGSRECPQTQALSLLALHQQLARAFRVRRQRNQGRIDPDRICSTANAKRPNTWRAIPWAMCRCWKSGVVRQHVRAISPNRWPSSSGPKRPIPKASPAGDAWQRARIRQLAELINAGTQPLVNLGVGAAPQRRRGGAKAWNQHWIRKGPRAYEKIVRETAGRLSVGDSAHAGRHLPDPAMLLGRRNRCPRWKTIPTIARIHAEALAARELPGSRTRIVSRPPDTDCSRSSTLLRRQSGLNPAADAAVHGADVAIAHALDRFGRERRTGAATAIQDDLGVETRDLLGDIALDHPFSDMDRPLALPSRHSSSSRTSTK